MTGGSLHQSRKHWRRNSVDRDMGQYGLDRMILLGERHFRHAVSEFVAHYHRERNHQGLENTLIERPPIGRSSRIYRQQHLGGLLNYYKRAA